MRASSTLHLSGTVFFIMHIYNLAPVSSLPVFIYAFFGPTWDLAHMEFTDTEVSTTLFYNFPLCTMTYVIIFVIILATYFCL